MAHTQKQFSQGVLALPLNQHGQFLITLRNDPDEPQWHRKWQVTGGGIEHGESPEQALSREVKEELSVSFRILFPYPIAKSHVWNLEHIELHVLLLCYIIDIGRQVPHIDGLENLKFKWIVPAEVNRLSILPLTDDFLFAAEQIVGNYNLISTLS